MTIPEFDEPITDTPASCPYCGAIPQRLPGNCLRTYEGPTGFIRCQECGKLVKLEWFYFGLPADVELDYEEGTYPNGSGTEGDVR